MTGVEALNTVTVDGIKYEAIYSAVSDQIRVRALALVGTELRSWSVAFAPGDVDNMRCANSLNEALMKAPLTVAPQVKYARELGSGMYVPLRPDAGVERVIAKQREMAAQAEQDEKDRLAETLESNPMWGSF